MIVGVTGHRDAPESIKGKLIDILKELKPESVISGMAIGFDSIVVEACIEINIPFIAAIPFAGQEARWPKEIQERYNEYLKLAEKVHICSSGGFSNLKYQIRNEWIVDHSNYMVSYWDNRKDGGTFNCIEYAKEKNLTIKNLYV